MVHSVDQSIAKLNEQVSVVVSKLEDPLFLETASFDDAEKVVADLDSLGQV